MATTTANKINAQVSFDIPAIISDPVLGFANFTIPERLHEEIEKLNITGAIFRFQKHGGTYFERQVNPTNFGTGKINATAALDVDSYYDVTVTLTFSDKDDVTSAVQEINTADDTEYGQIAKKIYENVDGRTRPLAGAVIEVENPNGANWTATSRATDGLVYLQRIPVGSYNVVNITKNGYDTLEPTQNIVVTPKGVLWNDPQPVYTMMPESATATPTGE